MLSKRLWQFITMLMLLVGLAGCRPDAEFTITPNPAVTGQEVTFDASASKAYREDKGNKITRYDWQFGDGTKASGKIVKHSYAAAGTVKVTLTVVDARGERDVATQDLVVKPVTQQGAVSVSVVSTSGSTIKGAKVSVGAVSAVADDNGVALLSGLTPGADQVVLVSKPGFVNQAVRVTLTSGQTAKAFAVLKPVAETLLVKQIELGQTLVSSVLNAQVTIPAGAFVTPNGQPATGAVTVHITPWSIENQDLLAMLGDGNAIDAAGAATRLLSAGMLSVEFVNAAGETLQLAAGKTAKIRMDLPATSLNGQQLAEGQTIPLWHFDEARALWVEEGVGTVVLSNSSWSGFGVEGTVSHFSSWNWDIKFNGGGTTTVKCVDANGANVDCNVIADVTLDDGSRLTKSGFIPAGGSTIINMPSSGTIQWAATTDYGGIGSATSSIGDTVTIVVSNATTSNFVRCVLPDNTPAACQGTLTVVLADGTTATKEFAVPADGGYVRTAFVTSNLDWSANSDARLVSNKIVYYSGSVSSSSATGSVDIPLTTENSGPEPSKTVSYGCSATAPSSPTPITSCRIDNITLSSNIPAIVAGGYYSFELLAAPVTLVPGQTVTVVVPAGLPADPYSSLYASGVGTDANGSSYYGWIQDYVSDLSDGAVRILEWLWGYDIPVDNPIP